MSHVLQRISLQIISSRWGILLAMFLFHFRLDQEHSIGLTLLIAFNTLLTWFYFQPVKRMIWRTVVISEIIILLILNSWFTFDLAQLYYLFTTFLIVGIVFPRKVSLILTFIYCLVATFISYKVQAESHIEVLSSLTFFGGFLVYLLIASLIKNVNMVFGKLMLILHYSKKLATVQSMKFLFNMTGIHIKRLLKIELCYICLYENNSFIDDWYNQYYTRALLSHRTYKVERKMRYISIESYLGDKENYLFLPLRIHKAHENVGGLLIPVEKKDHFSRFDFILLRMMMASFLNHLHLLAIRQDFAVSMKDEVRKKMAQDMHDGLAQQLFFLSAQIFQIKNQLSNENTDKINRLIEAMEKQTSSCQNEVRSFIAHLKGEQRESNIFDAIHQLVNRLTYNSSVEINMECQGSVIAEAVEVEEAIYRIMEESVNNVLKHANASRITIMVEVTLIQWTIKIQDDGVGFDDSSRLEQSARSYGVSGLKERAENVGGLFTLRSMVGNGTEITVIIPRGGMKVYA